MSFSDIFKNSFLSNYTNANIGTVDIVVILAVTAILAVYIFFIYRLYTRKNFYNKEFNISLVALALITVSIILSIQSSIVVSLGMVGALSIVRFRTAVKSAMDLIFLFWALAIGIICGVGLFEIVIFSSLAVTFFIFALDMVPIAKSPVILVVQSNRKESETDILKVISEHAKFFKVKSRNINRGQLNVVVEIRTKSAGQLLQDVYNITGIEYASVIDHNGETAF